MPKLSFCAIFFALVVLFATPAVVRANDMPAALSGQVTSAKEGAMEGVVVGAKKEGSTVTVNVTSDEKGRFNFPTSKLSPGRYAIKVRAAGYELDAPKSIEISAGKPATANLKLRPAKDISIQLTDAEWLLSIPGTEEHKNFLLGAGNAE